MREIYTVVGAMPSLPDRDCLVVPVLSSRRSPKLYFPETDDGMRIVGFHEIPEPFHSEIVPAPLGGEIQRGSLANIYYCLDNRINEFALSDLDKINEIKSKRIRNQIIQITKLARANGKFDERWDRFSNLLAVDIYSIDNYWISSLKEYFSERYRSQVYVKDKFYDLVSDKINEIAIHSSRQIRPNLNKAIARIILDTKDNEQILDVYLPIFIYNALKSRNSGYSSRSVASNYWEYSHNQSLVMDIINSPTLSQKYKDGFYHEFRNELKRNISRGDSFGVIGISDTISPNCVYPHDFGLDIDHVIDQYVFDIRNFEIKLTMNSSELLTSSTAFRVSECFTMLVALTRIQCVGVYAVTDIAEKFELNSEFIKFCFNFVRSDRSIGNPNMRALEIAKALEFQG